jgi:hypothetical protein
VTLPGLEGHISHKRFESPLISQSHFEDKPSKQRDEYCYYSKRIHLKFKLIQFESNAGINPPTAAEHRSGRAGGAAVNAAALRRRQTTWVTRLGWQPTRRAPARLPFTAR